MKHFASQDWNGTGRADFGDEFMEYMIFREVTESDDSVPVINAENHVLGYSEPDGD